MAEKKEVQFENIKNLFLELIVAKFLCQCIRLLLLLLRL